MPTDLEIARQAKPRPMSAIAEQLGLGPADLIPYGHDKAKIRLSAGADRPMDGKLILVSAMSPTPAGEGKTTVTVGLGQGFAKIGADALVCIREPSLGPVMGIKGGAAGGGRSQVIPMEAINLHFTGDMHAITSAHNLLAALVDNALHFREGPPLDPRRTTWNRVLDVNDRALRNVMVGLGDRLQGLPRQTGFDITAASEVMAVLSLARDRADLRARLKRLLVGETFDRVPVSAGDLGADGPMSVLLDDAIQPNLVQTLEGTPATVHGGPFANIAHGSSSVVATRMGLRLSDYVITEAGFGFDLGGEKFFDIVCRAGEFGPSVVVLVATIRALKMHGGVALADLAEPDPEAVARGLPNLEKHLETADAFGVPVVVALNRFTQDTDAEISVVAERCTALGHAFEEADVWGQGGAGAVDLARRVKALADGFEGSHRPLYSLDASPADKIRAVARQTYGADAVHFTRKAELNLKRIARLGYDRLPVCIAKTQSSLSDDPKRRGRPTGFDITVREVLINAGAGFLVPLTGDVMRMPGLPRKPAGLKMGLDADGQIYGLA
ncbi:MAG: formate--tetrahydrofolate ligase [Bradymonadia bacterium]|jgi:formate--tetrahydrofolate ligase